MLETFLDYMELADLLTKNGSYFYLKGNELQAIQAFARIKLV